MGEGGSFALRQSGVGKFGFELAVDVGKAIRETCQQRELLMGRECVLAYFGEQAGVV